MSTAHGANGVEGCEGCLLRREGWFCDLAADALHTLDATREAATYPKGAVLFAEGEAPRGVYVLCRGSVKLSTASSNARVLITHLAEAGEALGLSAAMAGTPYEVTAETLSPTQVVFINRAQFLLLLDTHRGAYTHAAEQLNRDYQRAYEQARLLGLSGSAAAKLACLLLQCAARHGREAERGIRMSLPLTHEEIGQLIGASRETVTRLFGRFRSRQILQIKGPTILLQDKQALEEMVGD